MWARIHHHVHCSLALRIPRRSRFLAKPYRSSATLTRSSRTKTASEFERLVIASVDLETEASSSCRYALTRGQSWFQRSLFPSTFLVADSVSGPFDTLFRLPRPKSLPSKLGRARFVCHPIREHLVSFTTPRSVPSLLTEVCRDSPANQRLSENPYPIVAFSTARAPKDSYHATRRFWVDPRCVQIPFRQAGQFIARMMRASDRASPLGASSDLSAPFDVVDIVELTSHAASRNAEAFRSSFCPRPRFPGMPKHLVFPWPPWRRLYVALHAHGANDTPNSLAVGPAVSFARGLCSRWIHPQQE